MKYPQEDQLQTRYINTDAELWRLKWSAVLTPLKVEKIRQFIYVKHKGGHKMPAFASFQVIGGEKSDQSSRCRIMEYVRNPETGNTVYHPDILMATKELAIVRRAELLRLKKKRV